MFLALPASSAPAERVFSASGFLKPALRNRLGPQLLKWLTIIRCFIKTSKYSFDKLFLKFYLQNKLDFKKKFLILKYFF